MAKGRFSNPRPYREEEREIEQAFRQVTSQTDPPRQDKLRSDRARPEKPQRKTTAEKYAGVSADPAPAADTTPDIPDVTEFWSESDIPVSTDPMIDATRVIPDVSAQEAPARPVSVSPSEPADVFPDFDELYPDEEQEDVQPSFMDKALDFVEHNKKAVLAGLCAVALVLIVGVIAIFLTATATDPYDGRILNNVTVAGVNVGGMTKSEAITAVRQATEDTFTEKDMVVRLGEETLLLSPDDTGARLDVKAAVNAAYDYGRAGTKAEKQAAYNASLTGNPIIGLLPYLKLDEDYIMDVLEEYAGTVGSILTETTYEIEGDIPVLSTDEFNEASPNLTLVLTMGTPGVNFDVETLYAEILDAYSLNCFEVKMEDADPESIPAPVDLQAIYDEVCVEPVDASMDMETYETIPGSYGYTFDIKIAQKLVDKAEYGEEVRIAMEYVAPEILDDNVLFRDVLGACETPYTSNANRTANLKLACAAIDGLVLNPGETFSFNKTVGERTAARGYKSAPAYSGNELVDTIGGGVCQVSSTLYCATLTADLETVSRTNHSFPVSYIDYGMDATVSYGSIDFKFRNNTNYPIKIEASVSGGKVSIQILGTDEKDYYIEMSYLIDSTYKPETEYETFEYDNAEGYKDGDVIQEGITGYFVKTYKNRYNKETGRLVAKDYAASSQYKTVNRIVAQVAEPETTVPETEPETTPPETTLPPETTVPPETTQPSVEQEPSGDGFDGKPYHEGDTPPDQP